MMKIYFRILSITVVLFLLSAGCEDILSDLLTFDSDYYIINFAVDPIDKTGYHIFSEEIAKSDLDSLLEANGLSKEKLEEVHVKEAVLKITDSDASITFDPLEKISVTIYTEELKEKTIVSIDHIPDGSRELEPVLDEDDIKDYLFEDEFILSAIGVLEERTYKTISVQAKVKFEFRAGLKE